MAARYKLGPIFTPPVEPVAGSACDADAPERDGWRQLAGRAIDPETKMFYIFNTQPTPLGMVKDPSRSDMDFIQGTAHDPNALHERGGGRRSWTWRGRWREQPLHQASGPWLTGSGSRP